jgi:hypothetical protein
LCFDATDFDAIGDPDILITRVRARAKPYAWISARARMRDGTCD